ncbi:MAG: AtzE family amidohydrolase, partial [Pseudoxanthomonas sp.]
MMQIPVEYQAGIQRNADLLDGYARLLRDFSTLTEPANAQGPGQIAALANATRATPGHAHAHTERTLERIAAANPALCAFTRVLPERARADAARVQASLDGGRDGGAL